MAKGRGGFIGQDGLNAPDSPTGVTGTAGDQQVSVAFTAPTDVGGSAITAYRAQSNDGIGASGSSSPLTVTGLTNGTAYTFNVWAINAFGYSAPSDASGSVTPAITPQIAVFSHSNAGLDQFNMATEGSVTDFGTISLGETTGRAAVGSATRGVFNGSEDSNVMTYITFSSAGNGTDFGDQSQQATGQAGMGNSTRGLFSGGVSSSTNRNYMDYITIASTGNSATFGSLTEARRYARGCASPTRGLVGSGYASAYNGTIDYVTIASTGNATDFGDLSPTYLGYSGAACSSSTRAIWAGGTSANIVNNISYVTIASTGNSSDFGDLTEAKYNIAGCSNSISGYFFGGQGSPGAVQNIDKITIASTGNATDTGVDVKSTSSYYGMAASDSHGGIS